MAVPNGGGVTINSGVSANQDLSGIQFIRPARRNDHQLRQSSLYGTLKLGTIFNSKASNGNARLSFAPACGATIEVDQREGYRQLI